MKARHRRFAWIGAGVVVLGAAAALVLNAFQSNLVFFFTPSQVTAKEAPQGRPFRIGGLVEAGSLKRKPNSVDVQFVVTDTAQRVPVVYSGLLPDLFKEGKGVVAQGSLRSGRHVPRHRSAGEARRELHAARSGRGGREGEQGQRHVAVHDEGREMIPELGHFALILALLVAFVQGIVAARRRAPARRRADGDRRARRARAIRARRVCVRLPRLEFRHQRFFRRERRAAFEHAIAAAVPDRGDVGLARRLAAAVDADADRLGHRCHVPFAQSARGAARARARGDGTGRTSAFCCSCCSRPIRSCA